MPFASFAVVLLLLQHTAQARNISIPAPGGDREAATVVLPDHPEQKDAWPLVLLLHGFSSQPDYVKDFFHFDDAASERGFVLVAPKGKKNTVGARYWNATDGCCDFEHSGTDDVSYLLSLLREVGAHVKVDARRVYVVGHSNGGFMAHRLVCDTKGIFAAVVSVAGVTWKDASQCSALDTVSLLQVHAVDDGTIKFDGDKGYPSLKPYPGAEESVARYVAANKCAASPAFSEMDATDSIPGIDADTSSWNTCSTGVEVALWKIRAHRGPGHSPHKPKLSESFRARLLDFLLNKTR